MRDKKLIYLAYEMGFLSKLEVLKTINIEKYGRLKCAICKGLLVKTSIDHILPASKGGDSKLDNLRLTHTKCNGKKDNKFTLKEKLKIILI